MSKVDRGVVHLFLIEEQWAKLLEELSNVHRSSWMKKEQGWWNSSEQDGINEGCLSFLIEDQRARLLDEQRARLVEEQ